MDQEFKYLAIRNWEKYQATRDGQPSSWIKDYTDKDNDPEYSQLTALLRYTYDACRRLRGRFGRNLTNDPQWICRAIAALPQERHNIARAVSQLVHRGLLIPTNQQVNSPETPIEEKSRLETLNLRT